MVKFQRSVSISLAFNYDGATTNRMPNDEPFTIDGIKNDEIIESALVDLGKKDAYTAESVRNSMTIIGSFPEDVISRISEYTSIYEFVNESSDGIKSSDNIRKSDYFPTLHAAFRY